jgi:hypothetical protein
VADHWGRENAKRVYDASEVQVQDEVPVIVRRLDSGLLDPAAGVIYQDVNRAKTSGNRRELLSDGRA